MNINIPDITLSIESRIYGPAAPLGLPVVQSITYPYDLTETPPGNL